MLPRDVGLEKFVPSEVTVVVVDGGEGDVRDESARRPNLVSRLLFRCPQWATSAHAYKLAQIKHNQRKDRRPSSSCLRGYKSTTYATPDSWNGFRVHSTIGSYFFTSKKTPCL